jgi:MFS family permease
MFLLGGVFAAQFGMASVWGTLAGLSVREISLFVAAIYLGGLLFQFPVGFASDRIGRRPLILWLSLAGAAVTLLPLIGGGAFWVYLVVGVVVGGVANPLYALLLAYTNDFLDNTDMAAASAGLIFINGLGAIGGPIATGWVMERAGPNGFFLFMGGLFLLLGLYAMWRMMRRRVLGPLTPVDLAVVSPTATSIAVEAAMEPRASSPQDKAA